MTVTVNDGRIEYTGNGATTVFAYDFLLLDQAHVEVYLNGVLKTISTHYTVSGVGTPAGGNVTFLTAPASSVKVLLLRNVPLTQSTDYQTAAKFPAETHEAALDKLTMIAQQLTEREGRALRLSTSSLFENLVLPDPVSQRLIRWKTDLTGFENVAASDLTVFSGALITTEGDIIQGGAGGVPERLPIGANTEILTVVAGKANWEPAPTAGIQATIVDAKGDLIVATAADTVARKAVGTNGQVLSAQSAQADGLLWVTLASVVQPSFLMAPESAAFGSSAFPQLKKAIGTNWVGYSLGFDQTTAEAAFWKFKIPTTAVFTAATIKIVSRQLAAVTGNVAWQVTTITRADGEAYDTAGVVDNVAAVDVHNVAGELLFQTKALTVTGWAAGEMLYVKLARDVAADTVAEDAEFVNAVIELS